MVFTRPAPPLLNGSTAQSGLTDPSHLTAVHPCIFIAGSEKWTSEFGYPITDKWRPWYVGGQVAGYTQGYEHNLTFATILGAGHTVPEYKPAQALYFHYNFLHGHTL